MVAGHRRLYAVKASAVRHGRRARRDDGEAFLLTLVENLQRSDLSAREESRALETLVRERAWSTRQVAEAIKRSPAYVSKRLRVFEDPVLAPLVLQNRITISAAEELLTVPPERRRMLAERADERWDHGRCARLSSATTATLTGEAAGALGARVAHGAARH